MDEETWTHGTADLGGLKLRYVTAGEGPLVLLLHGFPEFWYSWRHQIPVLAQRYQVVAPDLRGYNDSDKPPGVRSYGLDLLAADVRALVRHFGHEKAVVAGHDWGGAVAWAFASAYPQAAAGLIVLNCPHPEVMRRHLLSNPRQLLRSWYMFLFQLPRLPERRILRDPLLFVKRAFRGGACRKEAFTAVDLQRYAEAIAKPGAATGGLNYYRAAVWDLTGRGWFRFEPIAAPTLLLWGEEDPALGKELTYHLEPCFTGGNHRLRYIPRCGHWVQQEQPEAVNRHMLEFLDELRL